MSNAVHALATLITARPSVVMAKYAGGDLLAASRHIDDVVRTMKRVPKSGVSSFWRTPLTAVSDDAVRASTMLHAPGPMSGLAGAHVGTLIDRMLATIDETLAAANRVLA